MRGWCVVAVALLVLCACVTTTDAVNEKCMKADRNQAAKVQCVYVVGFFHLEVGATMRCNVDCSSSVG